MASAASANQFLLVSRNDLGEAVAAALCLYVGRGRRYSVKQLSNGTGVPDRQIECAKIDPNGRQGDDWRPLKFEEFFSLAKFLGEGFTSEVLRLSGQGAYTLPEDDLPGPSELVRDCAEDTAEVAVMAAGEDEFDHDDVKALRRIGHRLVERGMQLVAALHRKGARS